MVAKSKLDPQHERYRSRGALITLPQMLIQRQAAKALSYVSHARSIAGTTMNSKSIKSFAALILLGTSISVSMNPAKADHWCYRWESNCKIDGRTGTSGNDFLGLAGGDTVEKAIGIGAASLGGSATVPIIGTVSGAAVGATVAIGNGLYQTYKRERDAYYSRKDAEEREYDEAFSQFERELEAQGIR